MAGGNRRTGQDERRRVFTLSKAGLPFDADHRGHGVTRRRDSPDAMMTTGHRVAVGGGPPPNVTNGASGCDESMAYRTFRTRGPVRTELSIVCHPDLEIAGHSVYASRWIASAVLVAPSRGGGVLQCHRGKRTRKAGALDMSRSTCSG